MGVRARARAWLLREGYRFSPSDIQLYGFDSDRPLTDAGGYLGYRAYKEVVRPVLNSRRAHALTENKWIFNRLLASYGLPIPRTYGLLHRSFGMTWDGRPLRSSRKLLRLLADEGTSDVVLKAAGGIQQRRLFILHDIDHEAGTARFPTGETVSVSDIVSSLRSRNVRGYPGYLAQAYVRQHALLMDLAPYTPNTLRVVTFLTRSGKPQVHMACVRLGRKGNMADAWNHGGVSVGVDLASGTLLEGVLKPKHGGEWITKHPDTGAQFAGRKLPYWEDVMSICRRGARIVPGTRSLGWDILLTDSGPVVLEANSDWDLQMVQVHTPGYLEIPGVRDSFAELGVELPTASRRAALGRALRSSFRLGSAGRRRR